MIDFSLWDSLLREYVNQSGQVDYQRWQLETQGELDQWLNTVSNLQLNELKDAESLSFLINIYNALVIAKILKKYPIKSILPRTLGVPNWLAFFIFFSQPVHKLNNQQVSLNDIEHKILRQQWQEPRIHFALVCAAIGCPLLRNEAYQPEFVYDQLEADAVRFINNTDKVSYDPELNQLFCSKIFKWYEKDFLHHSKSVADYIKSYLRIPITEPISIQYLPYSWQLNEQ
ncbi:DUF547 domain-containing protein [Euhalothece natronophila Z-M001]|uniref:DUF547 domain-containing protein n=1 Tax=Euhalothece natronophila Z-M001 TaxID=522448 RepID=A0A5B8NJG5_9CHRO|nr:DUF547 domain-containing protein [Euhalothece natronophila]QDZ39068.1 DUF547 domain-containing protein [Euhalothece natronophila Z-M001]